MRAFLIALLAAALASAGGMADAKPCPERAKAKRAFDAGHLAYRRGAYEEAILKFQDSYGLCEMALTLLAIANAYERLGDLEASLEHLEQYRPHAAKGEQAEIDGRITTLKNRIEERKKEEEAKRREEEEAARKKREQEADRKKAEEAEPEPDGLTASPDDAGRPLWWTGWVAGGVGMAALVAGVATGASALSLDGDLADACTEGRCPSDWQGDIDQLAALSTATDVLLVVGGLLTAAGVTMLLLDSPAEPSAAVGITLGPGSAALRGSF